MKLVASRDKIKQNQKPQTNNGNTKTIHSSNRTSVAIRFITKPVPLGVLAGILFITTMSTAYGAEQLGNIFNDAYTPTGHADAQSNEQQPAESAETIPEQTDATTTDDPSGVADDSSATSQNSTNPEDCDDPTSSAGTDVTIESQSSSSSVPNVTINGESVEVPANGRVTENVKDDNSRTRIRARVDKDSDSSIHISTNNSSESEED